MENTRTAWRDNAKGIGISLVVFGHSIVALMAANVINDRVWHEIDFSLYSFHMPLFMFLAGISVPHSLAAGATRFIKSKIITVAYPYFVWSTIQFVIMSVLASLLSGAHAHDSLLDLFWRPISPYWFLYALFVFLIAAALLGMRATMIVAVVAFPFAEGFDKDTLVHQLLHFALFFAVGMLAAQSQRLVVDRGIAFAGLALAILTDALALGHGFANYNSVLVAPAAFGGSVFFIWLSQRIGQGWLAAIGRLSFPIYVMHVLGTGGVVVVMTKLLHVPPIAALYVTTDFAVGMVLPIVAYYVFRRIGVLPWLGLAVGATVRRWIDASVDRTARRPTAPAGPPASPGQS
jgi:uncharacterized membrane protein YcfT